MSRRYIDSMKELIEKEVAQRDSGTKVTMEFIADALARIVPKIRVLEELIWEVPPVDEQTLGVSGRPPTERQRLDEAARRSGASFPTDR